MLNGATQVFFEGVPTFPDAGRMWDVVDRWGVTQIYTAPTAIRALMAAGDEFVTRSSRASLRLLGTVGEPINPEAWRWYSRVVGEDRCPVVDTWWQTETGGVMIGTLPGAGPQVPGAAGLPMLGVVPEIVDSDGNVLDGEAEGILVIAQSWPGQARTVYGDHERFIQTYFTAYPGRYVTGDGCRRDAEGRIQITGRVDDVINVSGHRMGTAEVESALVLHPAVAEAAVVGVPHEIKGQGIYAYVALGAGHNPTEDLRSDLRQHVRRAIGPIATPDFVQFAIGGLPKTRSGKIMRRILRKIAANEHDALGDTSTLADPEVVEKLITRPPQPPRGRARRLRRLSAEAAEKERRGARGVARSWPLTAPRASLNPDRTGLGLAALAALTWALAGIWIRLLPGSALATVVTGRLGLALVALAPVVWAQRARLGRPTRAAWALAVAMVAYYVCAVAGFQLAPVAEVTLFVNASPAFAVALALAARQRVLPGERWGTAVALAGVGVIVAPEIAAQSAASHARLLGDACALGAAIVMAGYATAFRRLGASGPSPLLVTALTFALGAVGVAVLGAARGAHALAGLGGAPAWGALAALAVVSTAVPTLAFSVASQRLPPVVATAMRLLTPPCAALAAYLVLGEAPSVWVAPGGALVLGGLALTLRRR